MIAPGANLSYVAGVPVVSSPDEAAGFDAVLVTDIKSPQATFEALRGQFDDDRILVPELLRISRRRAGES